MIFRCLILIPLLLAGCAAPQHPEPGRAEADRTALETGNAILTVDRALQYEFELPDHPAPAEIAQAEKLTEAMVQAGQITRLYPWVSTRINSEILTAEHLLKDTHPDDARARQLNRRIEYLQRVRLLIDAPL
jgi:hypothetical protein